MSKLENSRILVFVLLLVSLVSQRGNAYEYKQLQRMQRFGKYPGDCCVTWYRVNTESKTDPYPTFVLSAEGIEDCRECLLTSIYDLDCVNNQVWLKIVILHKYDAIVGNVPVYQNTQFEQFNQASAAARACRDVQRARTKEN